MQNNDMAFAVLATDIAVLTCDGGQLKVLLTKAKSKSFEGESVLPGGLVGFDEKVEDAAKRVLKNFLTSVDFYRQQLFTFDDPGRDPVGRVVSVAYLMVIPWNKANKIVKDEATWRPVKDVTRLAYDHNEILKLAVRRLKGRMTYTNIVEYLMPEEFTLSELQKVYESVLETKLDKRNFVKKIKSLKLLKTTGHKMEGEAHRPALLYSFGDKEYRLVEVF